VRGEVSFDLSFHCGHQPFRHMPYPGHETDNINRKPNRSHRCVGKGLFSFCVALYVALLPVRTILRRRAFFAVGFNEWLTYQDS
jgi:hypothetical protein